MGVDTAQPCFQVLLGLGLQLLLAAIPATVILNACCLTSRGSVAVTCRAVDTRSAITAFHQKASIECEAGLSQAGFSSYAVGVFTVHKVVPVIIQTVGAIGFNAVLCPLAVRVFAVQEAVAIIVSAIIAVIFRAEARCQAVRVITVDTSVSVVVQTINTVCLFADGLIPTVRVFTIHKPISIIVLPVTAVLRETIGFRSTVRIFAICLTIPIIIEVVIAVFREWRDTGFVIGTVRVFTIQFPISVIVNQVITGLRGEFFNTLVSIFSFGVVCTAPPVSSV